VVDRVSPEYHELDGGPHHSSKMGIFSKGGGAMWRKERMRLRRRGLFSNCFGISCYSL